MAYHWISRGNELLALTMRQRGLTSRAAASMVTDELRRLGVERRFQDCEIGHLINNRRTLNTLASVVAMQRLFGIPHEAWLPGAPGGRRGETVPARSTHHDRHAARH